MKRAGSTKRVVRRVGGEDDDDAEAQDVVIKRPPLSKTKKGSKLRLSFGPGETDDNDEDSAVITPKKSLARQTLERNAERKTLRPAISSEQLTFRSADDARPSYSKDSLAELKLSTPSTPKDLPASSTQTSDDDEALDVTAKFGPVVSSRSGNAIPSAAEIKEKKERRARLAQEANEKDFIGLDADNSDEERRQRELLIRPREKYAETRLVRDDEDLAEGFDDYVEDGQIALGRKAEREERRRRRKEMEALIAKAEGAGGAEDDDEDGEDQEEVERNDAYEAAQTRAGTYGQRRTDLSQQEDDALKTPPKITPVPDLASVLTRLRTGLQELKDAKAGKEKRLEELEQERKDIGEREKWIQEQVKLAGEKYEKLRVEVGVGQTDENGERGLESYGVTPVRTPAAVMAGEE